MIELETVSSGVWQCPAVMILSESMSVTEQVETPSNVPCRSCVMIIPTLRMTLLRTSAGFVILAALSQCGGCAQNQNGS